MHEYSVSVSRVCINGPLRVRRSRNHKSLRTWSRRQCLRIVSDARRRGIVRDCNGVKRDRRYMVRSVYRHLNDSHNMTALDAWVVEAISPQRHLFTDDGFQ
jgi:hypothetical protein